jgi:hypothetical protein
MPLVESALHLRVVFPHLAAVYDHLPARTRALLSPKDAEYYDQHVNRPPRLVHRITRGDPGKRRELTMDLVQTVAPRLWHRIALDFARDTVENFLATPSFYTRVGVWHLWGDPAIERWFFLDADVYGYQRLVYHHPRLSKLYVGAFVLLFAACLPIAWRRGRVFFREENRAEAAHALTLWAPALVFSFLNAVSFAAYINFNNVRYSILAHAAILILVYRPAVDWITARFEGAPETLSPSR